MSGLGVLVSDFGNHEVTFGAQNTKTTRKIKPGPCISNSCLILDGSVEINRSCIDPLPCVDPACNSFDSEIL